ncbi:unnamed protein product, partial [Rotaria sp. Silwood2]
GNNPSTGTWKITGSMTYPRGDHIASVLQNGKVLVVGGFSGKKINTVELYDPSTEYWATLESMNYARFCHTASVLLNGKVLVTGGFTNKESDSNTSELY